MATDRIQLIMMRRRFGSCPIAIVAVFVGLLSVFFAACRPSPPEAAAPPPAGTPRLVVLLVADQFRADYLERGRGLYTGGLRRLLDDGVSFTAAHHAHAVTSTAPGHATLATGAYPAHHGVVANSWFDRARGEEIYCVDDGELEGSPANLRLPALGDWLKARYPAARVLSASGKDRAAVLLGGHRADGAFWYDREKGGFTTSAYYADEPPPWLATFNAAGPPLDFFLHAWSPLPLDAAQTESATAAGFVPFDRGPFDHGLPRLVGPFTDRPTESYWNALYRTPAVDAWLGRLGQELVQRYDLGADEVPDLLALSFSATDTVGHGFGPNSLEVLDTLRRLDLVLGELFAYLDQRVGRGHWIAAFSSDHGVSALPEQMGEPAVRAGIDEVTCFRAAATALNSVYGDDVWLDDGYLDADLIRQAGGDPAAVQQETAEAFTACPHVHRVRTLTSVLATPKPARPLVPGDDAWTDALYRHSADPQRSPDLMVQFDEGFVPNPDDLVDHGSPWPYDTHVPLVFLLPDVPPAEIPDPAFTVDLAPTLAALLDVPVPDTADGTDRSPLLRAP